MRSKSHLAVDSIRDVSVAEALEEKHENFLQFRVEGEERPKTIEIELIIRIMFLDFRKAYDRIDHNIMLENCCKIGIRPALVTWLASYLSGRT